MSLGERLKYVRGELTQDELGKILQVSRATVQRWEQKDEFPKGEALYNLRITLEVDINWLLTGEGEPYSYSRPEVERTAPPKIEYNPSPAETFAREVEDLYNRVGQDATPAVRARLMKTEEILSSRTTYADALASNIDAFHKAVMDALDVEARIARLEKAVRDLDATQAEPKKGTNISR